MTSAPLPDAEKLARLRLIRTDRVGPVSFRQLLRRFGSAAAALDALPNLMRDVTPATPDMARREEETVARLGARHLFLGDPDYPPLLGALDDAPPVLVVCGDPGLMLQPCVGMVGARNASAAARKWARDCAAELAAAGFTVASGLARGIDAAAHEGALPRTVACIAGGIDIAYPPENAALQDRIAREGLLIAEMPPGMQPMARHFPRRNRLIAGLSEATVVVEAAVGSGSLITARLAADLGREVMAVPGSPLDARARGCNALIKDGATLVESAADVIAALRPFAPASSAGLPQQPSLPLAPNTAGTPAADAAARFRELLSPVPTPIDDLVRLSGLPAAQAQAVLTDLELDGLLVRHAGGRVALA